MIIRRQTLQAALRCTGDEPRYVLTSIRIAGDVVEATNGHTLIRLTDRYPFADGDYPVKDLQALTQPPDPGILLPAEYATRLLKVVPKKATIDILTTIQVGRTTDAIPYAQATDLSVPTVINLTEANDAAHAFPNTDRSMVTAGQRSNVVRVILAPAQLDILCKIARDIGRQDKNAQNAITFEIPIDPEYRFTDPDPTGDTKTIPGAVNSAIRFTCGGPDIKAEGVIMPCRI